MGSEKEGRGGPSRKEQRRLFFVDGKRVLRYAAMRR